jgi:hypothetical protein
VRTAFVIAFTLVSTSAFAGPAMSTDDFADKIAGRALAPSERFVCFSRRYDAAHLDRHPEQNVTQATLLMQVRRPKFSDVSAEVDFNLAFRTRAARNTQVAGFGCEIRTDEDGRSRIVCIDAGCGYSHTAGFVETETPGKPRLTLTMDKLTDDNAPTDEPGLGDPIALHADDRVFALRRAPLSQCAPLIAAVRRYSHAASNSF